MNNPSFDIEKTLKELKGFLPEKHKINLDHILQDTHNPKFLVEENQYTTYKKFFRAIFTEINNPFVQQVFDAMCLFLGEKNIDIDPIDKVYQEVNKEVSQNLDCLFTDTQKRFLTHIQKQYEISFIHIENITKLFHVIPDSQLKNVILLLKKDLQFENFFLFVLATESQQEGLAAYALSHLFSIKKEKAIYLLNTVSNETLIAIFNTTLNIGNDGLLYYLEEKEEINKLASLNRELVKKFIKLYKAADGDENFLYWFMDTDQFDIWMELVDLQNDAEIESKAEEIRNYNF